MPITKRLDRVNGQIRVTNANGAIILTVSEESGLSNDQVMNLVRSMENIGKKTRGIPEEFAKGKNRPVKTVGGLVKQLERLPKSLAVRQGFSDGATIVVANVKSKEPVMSIEEADY